ncbi:DUF1761 domain-containing protein [Pseudooceanicola sp. LIPI14-2-Ac024]|uniref:DUF1761 domain-containing protein n=1 Tax=Pseudooceanicola sp. LIPI14-2-Ac024 TaxID=3344875 RepID=UPI0035CF3948
MNVIAILAAAAAGFVMGAVWYMTLAGFWLRALDIELDEKGKPKMEGSYAPFVVSAIVMLIVATMMQHILTSSGVEGAGASLVAGLGIGAFLITPWVAMNYAYAMRKVMLTVIDCGYAILGCGVIGLVLGLF